MRLSTNNIWCPALMLPLALMLTFETSRLQAQQPMLDDVQLFTIGEQIYRVRTGKSLAVDAVSKTAMLADSLNSVKFNSVGILPRSLAELSAAHVIVSRFLENGIAVAISANDVETGQFHHYWATFYHNSWHYGETDLISPIPFVPVHLQTGGDSIEIRWVATKKNAEGAVVAQVELMQVHRCGLSSDSPDNDLSRFYRIVPKYSEEISREDLRTIVRRLSAE